MKLTIDGGNIVFQEPLHLVQKDLVKVVEMIVTQS
jgi:hypothetical protein